MQQKILANVGFKNDYSYTNTFSAVNENIGTVTSIKDTMLSQTMVNTPLLFGGNGVPIQASTEATEKLDKIINIVKNGGEYYAFDLETLGKFNGTAEEQKAFSITEASLKKFTFRNGKVSVEPIHDLRLGVNPEQLASLRMTFAQAKLNPNSLTESQIFTLKTLSQTGSILKSNNLNSFQIGKDGMPIIPKIATGSVIDTLDHSSISHALNAYGDLINKGLYVSGTKGVQTRGTALINKFMSDLNMLSQNNLVLGHNSNVFDIPALNYTSNKYFGSNFSLGKGSIDTFELFKDIGLNAKELYYNQNTDVSSGYAKLENLSKLFGIEIGTAHIGSDDVSRLGMLGSSTINYGGQPMTLFEIMRNKAVSNISSVNQIKANGGDTLRVVQAPGLRDLKGDYLRDNKVSYDFMLNVSDDGIATLNPWTRSPLHANGFYNFNGISEIDIETLTKSPLGDIYKDQFKNLPDGTKKLFIGVFSNTADNSKKSFIVRDSINAIQKTIESTFELSNDITIENILKEEDIYRKDLARREISNFDQPGVKGMVSANVYYGELKELKEYEEILGREFTQDELRSVSKNGYIEFDDMLYKDTDIFSNLANPKTGELSNSRVNAFIEARKYLETTAPVSDSFASVINRAYGDLARYNYGKNGQTLAYRNSWNKLNEWITENGGELMTQTNDTANISKSKTFRVPVDERSGEFYSLDLSSKDKLKRSLKSIAGKEVLNNVNTNTKDLAKSQNLDSLYRKLGKLLTPEQIESLRKNKSIQYEIDEAADFIFENSQKIYSGLSNNELSNPFLALNSKATPEFYNTKDALDKNPKYKKYTGEKGYSNLERDINDLEYNIKAKGYNTVDASNTLEKQLKDARHEIKYKFGKYDTREKILGIDDELKNLNEQGIKHLNELKTMEANNASKKEIKKYKKENLYNIKNRIDKLQNLKEEYNKDNNLFDIFDMLNSQYSEFDEYKELLRLKKSIEDNGILLNEEEKIEKLKWIVDNTAINKVDTLDFKKGARVIVPGAEDMSIIDFIKSKDIDPTDLLENLAIQSIGESVSLGGLKYDNKTGKTDLSPIEDILTDKLNWTEFEQEQFSKVMTSKNGLQGITNSDGSRNLAWAFVETSDKNSRNNGIKLVLTDQKFLGTLSNAVETNNLNNGKFVVIDMPTRINKNGIDVIKKGGMEVADITSVNLFGRSNPLDLDVANTMIRLSTGELNKARHLDMSISSYTSQMINSLYFYKDDILDAIDNGRGEIVSSKYNRAINRVIQKSSGFTGHSNVINESGELVKKFIGNFGDISKSNLVDTQNFINLLPFLAKENEAVNNDLTYIFDRAGKNVSWNEYRDVWINELTNPTTKDTASARSFKDIDKSIKEYYVKNLLGKEGLVNKFINSSSIQSITGFNSTLPLLEAISKEGSQLLSSKIAQDGYVTLKGANRINAGSDIIGPMRDLIVQQTQYVPLHLGAIENNMSQDYSFNKYVNELNSRGITLGRTFESNDSEVMNLLDSSAKNGVIEGITGKVKVMNDHDILDIVDNFRTRLNSNSARAFADKYGLYKNIGNDELINVLKEQLSVFESRTMVYEQRAFSNPVLQDLFSSVPDIHQFNVNSVTDLRVSVGDEIKHGDFLGFDENGKSILYKDKRAGKITGIENGVLNINPFEKAILETKVNYGITEKSTVDVLENNDIFRAFFDEFIGKDVALVANPNQSKHLAGKFAFNEMNTIGQYLLQNGNESQQREFAEMLNTIGGSGSKIDVKEINGQTIKRFLYGYSSEGNTFDQYNTVINKYKALAEERKSDPFYAKLIQQIDSNKANREAVLDISIMQHNTQFSSQSDDFMENVTGHHGGKHTMRDSVYLGRKIGYHPDAKDKYYTTNLDGTKTSKSSYVVKHLYEKIRQGEDFISAQQDIKNIQYAIKLQRKLSIEQADIDIETANKMLVKKVKLSDLYLPTADNNSERIAETIFGIGEGYNVLEIDLGDMKILDPLTNERTNKFYMPVLKNQFIDGGEMLVKLDTQKAQSEFYNNLQQLMLNKKFDRKHAEKSVKDFWEKTYYSIENKDGYLNQKTTSGRLEFSSNNLYGGIVAPLYDENMNLRYEKYNVNLTRDVDVNGKTVKGVLDINYITEQSLREMIGDRGLEDIGFQLVNGDFDGNERFKQLINEKGLLSKTLDADVYEEIGRQFMLTEGIAGGIGTRYPAFHTGAGVINTVRLNPVKQDGTSVYTLAHTALKQNADVDFDTEKLAILGERDSNGRFRFYEKGTKLRGYIDDIIDAESLDNTAKWIPEAIKDKYYKLAEDNADGIISPEKFKEVAEKRGMRNGRWDSDDALNAIITARYKAAIADMSTPNYMLFDIATTMYEKSDGKLGDGTIKSIQEFTQLVEQSPISAKFTSISDAKKRINASAEYATSIAEIVTEINKGGDISDPFNRMIQSLGNMDILDIDSASKAADELGTNLFDVLSNKKYATDGTIEKMLDVMEKSGSSRANQSTLLYGLSGVNELFKSDFLLNAWNDTAFRYRHLKDREFVDVMRKLSEGEIDSSTFKGSMMKDILNAPDTNVTKPNLKYERVGSVKNKLYYDENDGSIFSVKDGYGLNDNSMIFNIQNTSDGKEFYFKNTLDDALKHSNSSIDSFLKNEIGLKEIGIAETLDAEGIALFENSDFGRTYTEGMNILENLNSENFFHTRENYINILDDYNRRIVEAGKSAKDLNSFRSQVLLRDIISVNMKQIDSGFNYKGFTEMFNDEFLMPGSTLRESDLEDKALKPRSAKTLSNRGGKSDNILYRSIAPDFDSYIEDLANITTDIIDNNSTLSSLSTDHKNILTNMVLGKVNAVVSEKDLPNVENLSRKLVDLYKNNTDEFRNNYGWGLDIDGAIASINLTTQQGIESSIETLNAFGEAKVGFGRYTGYKVSELSINQLEEINKDYIFATSNNIDSDYIEENMKAINNYSILKGHVASENIHYNEQVNNAIRVSSSNKGSYSSTMNNFLNKDTMEKEILSINEEMNDTIIRKSKEKGKRIVQDNIDNAGRAFSPRMSGKAFAVGAGILAATTMMMSYSGLASSLDPGATPSAKREDDKTINYKQSPRPSQTPTYNSNNAYMSQRTNTKIRMNSPYKSVNDPNVIRALNFAGGPNAKIQIHERNGQNNDSWLQSEIANNLV